jgi:predicted amidohydrolase
MVLPEYASRAEIERAETLNPSSVIVAAALDGIFNRAFLMHDGHNCANYLKMGDDCSGKYLATGSPPKQLPVLHLPEMSVGVVICMDVQQPNLLIPVVQSLRDGGRRFKFLCIPADMGGEWFNQEPLGSAHAGVHALLCNHPSHHDPRRTSFIADGRGNLVVRQNETETIYLDL